MRRPPRLGVPLLLTILPVGPLASQGVSWENTLSVSSGRYYFSARTTTWALTTSGAFQRGALTLRAGLPVYMQNSTLLTSGLSGPLPTGGGGQASGALQDSSNARKARGPGGGSGGGAGPMMSRMASAVEVPASSVTDYTLQVGDPTAQVSLWPRLSPSTSVGITGTVKVPASDYGTGEWDVGGSVGISQAVAGRLLVMLDAGYWHLGDLPELDLQDPWLGSASVALMFGGSWAASVSGAAARSVVAGFENAYSAGAALTRVGRSGSFGLSAMIGLTESSPDFSIGISWRQALGVR